MSAFTDLLANPEAIKFYLIELSPYDPDSSSVVNLYVSDHGFITEPSDTPANTFYEPRITEALNLQRSIIDEDRIRGQVKADFGEAVLLSGDVGTGNTLDSWAQYNWDGRSITVKLGGEDFAYSDYGTIGVFTAEGVDLSSKELTIRLRNGIYELDVPIQESKFAGTGGLEGNSDVKNKLKPKCYGLVRNIEPIYIGAQDLGDGSLETFAYNDGAANGVLDVYSNGNALTDSGSSTPASGEYRDYPDDGVFQLGGSTLDTIITADVEGSKDSGGTYVSTVADILELIITDISSLTMESGTVDALNTKNNSTVGIWIPNGENTLTVLSKISNSIGAFFAPNRLGEVVLGRVEEPNATEDESFDDQVILDIQRRASVLPIKGTIVKYKKAWRVHTLQEIAGAVAESKRTFLQNEWREETDSDSSVETAHPLSQEEEFETLLDDSTAASNEATRLQSLFGVDREIFEVEAKAQPFKRNLGDTVKITDSRFNLSNGKNFVIIGLEEVASNNKVTMTLWG